MLKRIDHVAFNVPLHRRKSFALVLPLVGAGPGLVAATTAPYLTGGTYRAFPHLISIPIMVGA